MTTIVGRYVILWNYSPNLGPFTTSCLYLFFYVTSPIFLVKCNGCNAKGFRWIVSWFPLWETYLFRFISLVGLNSVWGHGPDGCNLGSWTGRTSLGPRSGRGHLRPRVYREYLSPTFDSGWLGPRSNRGPMSQRPGGVTRDLGPAMNTRD